MRFLFVSLVSLLVSASPALAQVQIFRHPEAYTALTDPLSRETNSPQVLFQFWVTGFQPFQRVEYAEVDYSSKEVIADACGGLRMRITNFDSSVSLLPSPNLQPPPGVQPFQMLQGTFTPSNVPIGLIPKCKNGQWDVPPQYPVRTKTEIFFYSNQTVGVLQLPTGTIVPNGKYFFRQPVSRKRTRSANACGFILFRSLNSSLTIGGQNLESTGTPVKRFLCSKNRMFEQIAEAAPRPPQAPPAIDTTPPQPIGGLPINSPPPSNDPPPPPPPSVTLQEFIAAANIDGYFKVVGPNLYVPNQTADGFAIDYLSTGGSSPRYVLYLSQGRDAGPAPEGWTWNYDPIYGTEAILTDAQGNFLTTTVDGLTGGGDPITLTVYVSVPFGWF